MHPFLFLYLGIIASVLLDNRVDLLDNRVYLLDNRVYLLDYRVDLLDNRVCFVGLSFIA